MPDRVREKLIELQEQWFSTDTPEMYGKFADHLISNGVTFAEDNDVPSKWISVKDRLPEGSKKVLGTKKGASAAFVFYGKWHNGNWYDLEWSCYRYGVTHWMPLPEPPKGE